MEKTSDGGFIIAGLKGRDLWIAKIASEEGNGGPVAGGADLMRCTAFSKIAYDDINTASLRGPVSSYADTRTDKIWKDQDITYGNWFTAVAGDWNIMGRVGYSSGLYVVTFASPDNTKMIIAFRGTEFLEEFVEDALLADLLMTQGIVTQQFIEALTYYNLRKSQSPGVDITVTGHSLGGALAAYVSMHTGAKAVAINGAVGFAIDMAYKNNAAELAKVFTGTESWNFENHITEAAGAFDLVNDWVASPNRDKYDSYVYPKSNPNKDTHNVDSFLTYSGGKFGFTTASRAGSKGGKTIIYHDTKILNAMEYRFYLYLGTLGRDTFPQKTDKKASVYAYCGAGDDGCLGSQYADFLAGGSGINILDALEGKDVFFITDGDDTINDPSGDDKIMLAQGLGILSGAEDGNYYKALLSNGHYVRVNKFRNERFSAINVVSENGAKLGTIGGGSPWKAGASVSVVRAKADHPTTKHVEITGKATLKVYDEGGALVGTFANNADESLYKQFGYFYTRPGGDGETASITAVLFNGLYKLRVESAGSVRYAIYDFDKEDAPRTKFDVSLPLKAGRYLDTQSDFGPEDKVPFIIRDSVTDEEITRLTPEPKDPRDENDPDESDPDEGDDDDSGDDDDDNDNDDDDDNDNPAPNKVLLSILDTTPIRDVPNGTAKTAEALGLPATVTMLTSGGSVPANVTWNVGACSYNPQSLLPQTFAVFGTAALPAGVVNPNSVPLTVHVVVSVRVTNTPPNTTPTPRQSGGGGCDAGQGGMGLLITLALTVMGKGQKKEKNKGKIKP
ncbi:MAG: DUF2974 domain-containing protein [Synergistaceae bacterium]|nr:DUF2974 domain-containing protein [Synergistaceae bacterium]